MPETFENIVAECNDIIEELAPGQSIDEQDLRNLVGVRRIRNLVLSPLALEFKGNGSVGYTATARHAANVAGLKEIVACDAVLKPSEEVRGGARHEAEDNAISVYEAADLVRAALAKLLLAVKEGGEVDGASLLFPVPPARVPAQVTPIRSQTKERPTRQPVRASRSRTRSGRRGRTNRQLPLFG